MSDWLARKLAERQGQPPVHPGIPATPPGYGVQTVAPGYPRAAAPQVPTYPAPGQPPTGLPSANDIDRTVNPNDPYDTMVRAAAVRGDVPRTSNCPECHQDTLYQALTNESGYPLRTPPAPHCTNCGYPRMQSGSLHGGATALKPTGRAKHARQLTNHTVVVDYDGVPVGYEPQAGGSAYV